MRARGKNLDVRGNYTSGTFYGSDTVFGNQRHVLVYVKGEEVKARVLFHPRSVSDLSLIISKGYAIYRVTVDLRENAVIDLVRYYETQNDFKNHKVTGFSVTVKPLLDCIGKALEESPRKNISNSEGKSNCWKCGGSGRISIYAHIEDGVCFACSGFGKL